MKDRTQIIFFLACFFILANASVALCYTPPVVYVSGDGTGDFNCNGTNDQIQINQALQFVAGNSGYTTVHLKGPFTYVINDSILIGSNTVPEGDSAAVIKLADHAGWDTMKPLIRQKSSSGNSNITVRGFEVNVNYAGNSEIALGKGYYNVIYFTYCNNVKVCNLYMHDGTGDGLRINQCKNVQFYNNTIYKLGHDGIYAISCENVEAWNNRITCRTNSGLRIWNSKNVELHDNVIDSFYNWSAGGPGIQIDKSTGGTVSDVEVYGNIINNTYGPAIWIIGYGDAYPREEARNVHIHNNIFYSTGTNPSIDWVGGIVASGFYNTLIENNVFDGVYHAAIINMYPAGASDLSPKGNGYTTIVRSNIIVNTLRRTKNPAGTGYAVINYLPGSHTITLENNCLYNNVGGKYKNANSTTDIYADPLFADRKNHNYHLESKAGRWNGVNWVNDSISSPCIDTGYLLSDYSNEPVPNGSRINVGSDGNTGYASRSESGMSMPVLPTANFSSNVTGGYAPLSVRFTDLSQYLTSRIWDFGDSTGSTQQNPMHTYSVAGNYTVTLTVNNANGTDSKTCTINVRTAIPKIVTNFSSNVTAGYAPLSVAFTDTSTGTPGSWNWNFGDGTKNSTQKNPAHTYLKAGSYAVTLTANNGAGGNTVRKLNYITTRTLKPPVAALSANATSGNEPLTILFTDRSTGGSPALWNWSFGDGAPNSTEKNPAHTYAKAGKYTVSLTVSNAAGSSKVVKPGYITINALKPPVAAFAASRISGKAPLTVEFTDKSTGSPASYLWDFGDKSSPSTTRNPMHKYSKAGKYTVSLMVKNSKGDNSVTKSGYITVK